MKPRLVVPAAIGTAVAVAVLAVLVSTGGDTTADRSEGSRAAVGWSDEGRRVFAAMGCGSCHRLAAVGSTGEIGPDLDERLADHDRRSLIHSIVRAPDRTLTAMPDDYGDRMTDAELHALVSFLLDSR